MAGQADLNLTLAQVWQGLGAVALLGAGFGTLQAGAVGALVGTAVFVAGALVALKANRHRRHRKLEAQLPGFLEAIARGLRTGLQLGPAVVEAASSAPPPLHHEVASLADDLQQGLRSADAFDRWARSCSGSGAGLASESSIPRSSWARSCSGSGAGLAAAAMAFAATAGGARARAIDGVAATLRDRAALELEVRSLTSQARMSATMIGALPVGFMLLSAGIGDHVTRFLFTTRLGLVILAVGLSLDVIGALWMRRIVNSRD